MVSLNYKQKLACPINCSGTQNKWSTGCVISVPGEDEEQEHLWPGFFNRQSYKMSTRPKSQMHHRALSSPYSSAPLVTIFNLIKKE
jgi:hypothetical protein